MLYSLSLCLSLLGGWLGVYAAIGRAPYWGLAFHCVDRCQYSLPFWPAAAGERSVPLSQLGPHFYPAQRWRGGEGVYLLVYLVIVAPPPLSLLLRLGVLLGSLPALAKGPSVTCFVSCAFLPERNLGEERALERSLSHSWGSVFPLSGSFIMRLRHVLHWTLTFLRW